LSGIQQTHKCKHHFLYKADMATSWKSLQSGKLKYMQMNESLPICSSEPFSSAVSVYISFGSISVQALIERKVTILTKVNAYYSLRYRVWRTLMIYEWTWSSLIRSPLSNSYWKIRYNFDCVLIIHHFFFSNTATRPRGCGHQWPSADPR
jgi:hypothetical protein